MCVCVFNRVTDNVNTATATLIGVAACFKGANDAQRLSPASFCRFGCAADTMGSSHRRAGPGCRVINEYTLNVGHQLKPKLDGSRCRNCRNCKRFALPAEANRRPESLRLRSWKDERLQSYETERQHLHAVGLPFYWECIFG